MYRCIHSEWQVKWNDEFGHIVTPPKNRQILSRILLSNLFHIFLDDLGCFNVLHLYFLSSSNDSRPHLGLSIAWIVSSCSKRRPPLVTPRMSSIRTKRKVSATVLSKPPCR